jgi:hypothetical protein
MSANDVLALNANFEGWSKARAVGLADKGINPWIVL